MKKAQSEIIMTILFILIVLAAVLVVWFVVKNFVEKSDKIKIEVCHNEIKCRTWSELEPNDNFSWCNGTIYNYPCENKCENGVCSACLIECIGIATHKEITKRECHFEEVCNE